MPPRRRRGRHGGNLSGRGDGGDRGRGRVGRGRGGGSHGIRSDVDENKRGAAAANTLRATKFNRNKIESMLRLLKGTGHEAWSHITISEDNLNQWPDEGDICDVVENVVVLEVDDEDVLGDIYEAAGGESGVGNNIGSLVDRDGDDIGPALLQNDVIPSETYEGVLPLNASTESAAGNANIVAAQVNNIVQTIRGTGGQPGDSANDNHPQPQFNANQTTATFQHNVAAGWIGLEHFNGNHITQRYLTSYQCKQDLPPASEG